MSPRGPAASDGQGRGAPSRPQAAMQLEIRGRVQGVGYRYFARQAGAQLGLCGYVRNQMDGSVELRAEGPKADLEALLALCRQGPDGGRVDGVSVAWLTPQGLFTSFEIRR